MKKLAKSFPFRDVFTNFLDEYSRKCTYWYIPKARTLNDENVNAITAILRVMFENFLGSIWNAETQDRILERLVEDGVLNPYKEEGSRVDRTALVRIWKKLLETLGLLWVQNEAEIIITDVGLDLLLAPTHRQDQILLCIWCKL